MHYILIIMIAVEASCAGDRILTIG